MTTTVNYRKDFSMLESEGSSLIYFDNAATTFKPKSVVEAINNYYSTETATVHRGIYSLAEEMTAKQNNARETVRSFIGARSTKEIIFTSGTTASLNLVALSFGGAFVQPGDEILISEIEHHSNFVPWQMLARARGAILKLIPVLDTGELDLDALASFLSEKTKLVSLTHISNAFGVQNPIKEISKIIRSKSSAKIVLDGAQSAPHIPIDVQDLDVDFFAFSAHKLYGPTGIGVLYGKEELLEKMPPIFGGGDMIEKVSFDQTTYNELPFKFEAGTPHIAGIMGLKAAIDYLREIGLETICAHEEALRAYAEQKLQEIEGLEILGKSPQKGAIISFRVKGVHPMDLSTLLNIKGIALRSGHLCAQPGLQRFGESHVSRISFALYNTLEEVDQFILHLKDSINKLTK